LPKVCHRAAVLSVVESFRLFYAGVEDALKEVICVCFRYQSRETVAFDDRDLAILMVL
jgi:hypothetical protein